MLTTGRLETCSQTFLLLTPTQIAERTTINQLPGPDKDLASEGKSLEPALSGRAQRPRRWHFIVHGPLQRVVRRQTHNTLPITH